MRERDAREEYVLNESGIIWRGTHELMKPTPWNFAQVTIKCSFVFILCPIKSFYIIQNLLYLKCKL
jgi:hypothetical protein